MQEYKIYLMKRVVSPFLLICLTIVGVALLSQSLKFIDLIVNKGLGFGTFLYFCLLITPSIFWIAIPVALYIAIIFSLNKLFFESELTIFKASGLSDRQIISPILFIAFIATLFCYCLSIYLLPKSQALIRDLKDEIKNNFATLLIEEGIFSSPASGLTIYVKGVVNNQYQGILIHDARKDTAVTMMAEKGELEKTSSGPKLILYNGSRQEVKLESKEFSMLKFERYLFDLNDFQNKNNLIRTKQPDEKYLGGLLKDAFGFSTIEDKPKARAIAETFHRFTWPLYCIILTLLATLPFFRSLYTRGGFGRAILINSIIAFFLIIFAFIMKNSAGKGLFIALFFVLIVIMQYLVLRRLALKENTIG